MKNQAAATILTISGSVLNPLQLNYNDLCGQGDGQIPDVSVLDPSRQGTAIRLTTLAQLAGVNPECDTLTMTSSDGFRASVPLRDVMDVAVVIYAFNGEPLSEKLGGPARFWIPNAASCGLAPIDTCANVKHLAELTFVSR